VTIKYKWHLTKYGLHFVGAVGPETVLCA